MRVLETSLDTNQIVMSDSETPQHNPEHDRAPDASAGGPANGSPQGLDDGQSPAPSAAQPQSIDGGSSVTPPGSRRGRLAGVGQLAQSRKVVWAAVALLCVVVGVLGSLLGAHAVAKSDGAKTETSFHQGSQAIASTLKLAIQRQEELTVAAATYFAGKPKASTAEFAAWVTWARTLRRYPELDALGLLPAPPKPIEVSFPPAHPASAPVHVSPKEQLSRDTGLSIYTPISAPHRPALAVLTPVYRGNLTPRSVFGRRAASVGWLREVLVPGMMLRQVLVGHPGYALTVLDQPDTPSGARPSNLLFTSGAPRSGAQSTTIGLHDGWSVTSFGPVAGASVYTDGDALTVLIAGCLLSALLGLLIFVLGGSRAPAPAPAKSKLADEDLYEVLTGLPNRALTLDRAERMVSRTGRDSGMLAGALFVDVDRLKDVTEKLGQDASDQLLRVVGERLEGVVRAGDTVGRLGGDEFVVLVESAARGVRLDSLAQRMIETLHKPVELDDFGPSFVLTASIGVAFGRYETVEDLLRDAHLALVSAKAAGKDRYTLFNANMRTIIEGRAVLEAELNTALQDKQFFLLYQPIYDLGTRKVVGLEALIRWQHPTQGVLDAGGFLPLAEETELIVPLGRWVLEEACNRAAAWNVAGGTAAGGGGRVGVSVNVSANQLNRDGFATDVRRALQQSGIEPSLLTLEIAETTVMRDLAVAAERLQEIKQLGVSIAIDDFGGSGYARHSDLQRLPLDVLKVDRSTLAASEDEAYRTWLLEAILIVGREASLTVIATGIETNEQMTTLQTMGCTMAQGAFTGQPTPVDAVANLFAADLPPAQATFASLPESDPRATAG